MTDERIYHAKAVCRWCKGRFYVAFMDGDKRQWLCETPACAERQIAHAWLKDDPTVGTSPYLDLPTPTQVMLYECRQPNVLVGGAARGSKSHGLRWLGYKLCRQIPEFSVLLLRRTFGELKKTHLLDMSRDAPRIGAVYKPGDKILEFKNNGARVTAGHCDSAKDLDIWLSTEYDLILMDEASTFEADMIKEISARACTTKETVKAMGGAWVRLGTNPGGEGALYIFDHYITRKPRKSEAEHYNPENYGFIQAKVPDNPYAPEDYTETRLNVLSETRQRQLRDGDWTVFGSEFFPAWDETKHVRRFAA